MLSCFVGAFVLKWFFIIFFAFWTDTNQLFKARRDKKRREQLISIGWSEAEVTLALLYEDSSPEFYRLKEQVNRRLEVLGYLAMKAR